MEIGVSEFASRLQLSPQRVRSLLADGRLKGRQVGEQWLIDEAELKRAPLKSRPLSQRMSQALVQQQMQQQQQQQQRQRQGEEKDDMRPSERARIRNMLRRLASDPDNAVGLVRAWLRLRAERKEFAVAAADVADLLADGRVVLSGVSDSRAGISAAGEVEGYVRRADLDGLVNDFLLVDSGRSNVLFHVVDAPVISSPVPALVLVADLADRESPRELGQAQRLLRESVGS